MRAAHRTRVSIIKRNEALERRDEVRPLRGHGPLRADTTLLSVHGHLRGQDIVLGIDQHTFGPFRQARLEFLALEVANEKDTAHLKRFAVKIQIDGDRHLEPRGYAALLYRELE